MKKHIYPFAFRLGLLLETLCVSSLPLLAQGFSPATEARLQSALNSFVNNPDASFVGGLSAAVKVDGLAFWQGAAGYTARRVDEQNNLLPGGTPFTTRTLSRMYSPTKTFTAALTIELAQEGAFNLDDLITQFIPLPLINLNLNPNVTIRQLLAHESGYSDFLEEQELQIAIAFQPDRVWNAFEATSYVHQLKEPGTTRSYSSTNYILLGAIIEAATGKPIEQHFRERFFNPLGLSSMYLAVREPHGNRAELAAPHDNIAAFNPVFQLTGQPTFPDAYTNISRFPFTAIASLSFTSGGIVTNITDMVQWGSALFGGRATRPSTLQTMLNSISTTPDEDGDFLGYGIWRSTRISETDVFIGHDGNAPGYRSVLFHQPDRKLTLAILTNFHGADIYAIAKALYKALPEILCGNENRKEDKVQLCVQGKTFCVARPAASLFLKAQDWWVGNPFHFSRQTASLFNKRVAYLGGCNTPSDKPNNRTLIAQKNHLPEAASLSAAPNPFTDHTQLTFMVPATGPVTFELYDLNGRLITTLYTGVAQKGTVQQVILRAGTLPPGIYITRLQTTAGVNQQKLILRR